MKLFKELKRRNVFKAAISYLVAAWVILQIVAIVFPILQINLVFQRWIFIALVIGFPAWIVFAYIYEWTPEGFKQTSKVAEDEHAQKTINRRSNQYIIAGLSLAIILLLADKVFHLTANMGPGTVKQSTIAVLPFSHMSNEGEDEFFTDGVHEDVMTKLAGIHDFRIISKSAVMPYRDFEGDLKELGDRLKAQYFLEGSVRRWQDQVRITVQLIDANSSQVLWSHEYDGELENVFELQSSIATEITQKLQANLTNKEKKNLETAPTTVLAAYDDYLKARYILNKPRTTYDDLMQTIELLDQAVDADGKFTKAWTLLVQAHSERYSKLSKVGGREEEMEQAKQAAEIALNKSKKLAPDNWEVLSNEGFYNYHIKGDKIAAMRSFEKAIEENPSDLSSILQLGQIYITIGEVKKATSIAEQGFEIAQTNGLISYHLTMLYEIQGQYQKMVPLLERLYDIYPEDEHYLVESKYYQFLQDGKLSSYKAFKNSVKTANAEDSWDERAIKNMDMVVAMFDGDFEKYHTDWEGKHARHIQGHGEWICPLVANDHVNHAKLLLDHRDGNAASEILAEVKNIVQRPINLNSVCIFNPDAYLPKLDYLMGDTAVAKQEIENVIMDIIQNDNFPTGAVERSVILEAVDMIMPEKVYYYYDLIVKNTISLTSFESICADPWTYPNLIKDPQFIAEVKTDGRFVEFLESYGFLTS